MTKAMILAIVVPTVATVIRSPGQRGFPECPPGERRRVLPRALTPAGPVPAPGPFCPVTPLPLYLVQGRRTEFVIINRPFLADYNLTVDTVITLASGPQIRALEEAANLKAPLTAQAAAPVTKGGVDVISPRTAFDVLNALLDETTASKPESDLDADAREIQREQVRIHQEIQTFRAGYRLLRGTPGTAKTVGGTAGAPDMESVLYALRQELIQ